MRLLPDEPPLSERDLPEEPQAVPRRRFLRRLALLVGASAITDVALPACARRDREPRSGVPVALVELPLGKRVVVAMKDLPVEIVRTATGATARTLVCTHRGCPVIWKEELAVYHCPCHDGRFDADGRPIAGPPNRPLRTLAVSLDGGFAWVEI